MVILDSDSVDISELWYSHEDRPRKTVRIQNHKYKLHTSLTTYVSQHDMLVFCNEIFQMG